MEASKEDETTTEDATTEDETTEDGTSEEETSTEEITPEGTSPEETTPEETTPAPTTPEPTTPEPTTPAPTTPEPTTPEQTTPVPKEPETTPAPVTAVSITGKVNGTHYIGDTLSAGDFVITVTMSDGSKLTNPAGFAVSPLTLSAATNTLTCAYGGVSGTFTVNAAERPTDPTQPAQPSNPTVGVNGMDVVKKAIQYMGVPYVHGGSNLATGTDCSNFTRLLYAQYGVALSGSAAGQFDQGTPIAYEQLKPGDLVVQKYAPGTSQYTGHVAMFIGTDERGWGIVINEYPDEGVVVGYIMQNERSMYEYRRVCNNTYSGSNEGAYREAVLYSENTFGIGRQCGVMLCGHVLSGTVNKVNGTKTLWIYNGLGLDETLCISPDDQVVDKARVEKYKDLYLKSDWAYYEIFYQNENGDYIVTDEMYTGKFWD